MPEENLLAGQELVAFLATRDPERAKAFFGNVLGLAFVSQDRFAVVFNAGGTELRIAIVSELHPASHTVLGWHVADVRKKVEELTQAGVTFERYPFLEQDELGIWSAPGGARVAWFKDPDGNTLSVHQRA